MTDKVELIKAKVEEKINLYERLLNAGKGGGAGLMSKIVALQGVLIDINFIQMDSLPEEPVSRCLEEAAEEYTSTGYEFFDSMGHPHVAPAFKAGAQWQKEHSFSDSQINENIIYAKGYKQAEKDNALTWEDMRDIYDLAYNLRFPHKKQKVFFEEVLKRFLEQKGG